MSKLSQHLRQLNRFGRRESNRSQTWVRGNLRAVEFDVRYQPIEAGEEIHAQPGTELSNPIHSKRRADTQPNARSRVSVALAELAHRVGSMVAITELRRVSGSQRIRPQTIP
jgi:hypothetical protein